MQQFTVGQQVQFQQGNYWGSGVVTRVERHGDMVTIQDQNGNARSYSRRASGAFMERRYYRERELRASVACHGR